jgi:hypothetical protein
VALTDIALTLVSPPLAAARRRKLTAERRAISQARLAFYAFARGETLMRGEQELLAQYFDDYGSNRKDPVIGEELRIAQDLTARLRSGSLQRESLNPAQRAIIERYEDLVLDRQRRDDGDAPDDGDAFTPAQMQTIEMVRQRLAFQTANPQSSSSPITQEDYALFQRWVATQGGGTVQGLRGLGQTPAEEVANAQTDSNYAMLGWAVTVGGAAGGAYHGYKRNRSIGWAVWWGLMGALFPIFTIPIAIAQGFGKREK